ncbi:YfcE family phosphodiesterase [Salinicola socius]|uniref:YfcE family phosphodiesterase n=1 Tax=Salinicola socius TaxID=404433 RepID=A0A1Q8SXW0_9GAMM|nr:MULTISPECIES: metallophosphoesterase family protein [Salinicola]OLO06260.1 YfcE family phosphodiesterase [Salinicola socius]
MPADIVETTSPVGVISDTHGLLRDEALALLADCHPLIHLGDVGDPAILERLSGLAPVFAVRGNIDREGECATLPSHRRLVVNGHDLQLVHDIADIDAQMAFEAVLHGHSHKPRNAWRDEAAGRQLWFNPGAAGRRRFRLPITLGKLWIDADGIRSAIIHLPL